MKTPHEILGIDKTASEEEIKKAYRALALKHHPDHNKDPNAANTFDQITKAYNELLESKNKKSQKSNKAISFIRVIQYPLLKCEVSLTVADAALGCKKNIQVSRYIKCESCDGQGGFFTIDVCDGCQGAGRHVRQERGMFIIAVNCPLCEGVGQKFEKCTTCSGQGTTLKESSFDVVIPGGVNHSQIIKLRGAGHYASSALGFGYSDIMIVLSVVNDQFLLEGLDVISTLEITLLEALEGTNKKIHTVHGESNVEIPKLSKNKDRIIKSGFGSKHPVDGTGNHVCILNIKYPDKVDSLIHFLKG